MISLKRLSLSLSKVMRNSLRNLSSKSDSALETIESNTEKNIIVEKTGGITLIGINRSEKKNCLDVATAQSLSEALDAYEKDEECSVAVLHGIGGTFCGGYDLKEIAKYDGESEDSVPQFGPLSNRNSLASKPLIAAINGYAVGVGLELALMCDMRVIEESALVGISNRRFGVPMMCGGTVRLPAIVGYSRAMDLIITGRLINGEEAFHWGLANRLVDCGTALGDAVDLALSLIKYPRGSLQADRTSAHFATFCSKHIEEALQFEKDNSSHLLLEEGVKGAKKFTEGFGRHGKVSLCCDVKRPALKELDSDFL